MRYSKQYLEKNFRTKLKALINSRYANLAPTKRRGKFTEDYDNAFHKDEDGKSVGQSVKSWLSENSKVKNPGLDILINICELLDCDVDYFLTDQKEFKKETAHASEYLGLSYDTVERISNYEEKIKGLLDVIIFNNHNNSSNKNIKNADLLLDLLESIHEYALNYSTSSIKYKTASGIEYEITDKKQIDTLLRNNSIRDCGTILNTVYVEYSETRHYNDWMYMNNIIIDLSEKGEDENELRKKFHVPKKYNHSIPTHL